MHSMQKSTNKPHMQVQRRCEICILCPISTCICVRICIWYMCFFLCVVLRNKRSMMYFHTQYIVKGDHSYWHSCSGTSSIFFTLALRFSSLIPVDRATKASGDRDGCEPVC